VARPAPARGSSPRAIHDLSPRKDRTFVKLNCAAIPTGLLESELFGHERGAFTGAIAQKVGRFELAHQGTLFLDEVATSRWSCNPSCCACCRSRSSSAWAAHGPSEWTLRLVAATNRDLAQMVAEGRYRSDLYYRLNVFPLLLPPLRERRTTYRAWCDTSHSASPAHGAADRDDSVRGDGTHWSTIPGRATSASCRTSSNVR